MLRGGFFLLLKVALQIGFEVPCDGHLSARSRRSSFPLNPSYCPALVFHRILEIYAPWSSQLAGGEPQWKAISHCVVCSSASVISRAYLAPVMTVAGQS